MEHYRDTNLLGKGLNGSAALYRPHLMKLVFLACFGVNRLAHTRYVGTTQNMEGHDHK